VIDLVKAAPYVRRHRGKVFVIKIGGACLARPGLRHALAKEIALVELLGSRVVIVHGSGPQTDQLQEQLGEVPHKIGGRRVTSALGLRALRQATVGELNGDLAAALTTAGADAVGLAAGTGGILVARKREPVVTEHGVVDFGEVGDVTSVNTDPLSALLDAGVVPVLSPPAADGRGGFLNVNADIAAAHIAVALGAEKLVLVTSTPGILTAAEDPDSLASTLTRTQLAELECEGSLRDGMRVKASAIQLALEGGVPLVHVVSGLVPGALLGELYTTNGTGTLITADPGAVAEEALV
jgi:acetylglutamate kinase